MYPRSGTRRASCFRPVPAHPGTKVRQTAVTKTSLRRQGAESIPAIMDLAPRDSCLVPPRLNPTQRDRSLIETDRLALLYEFGKFPHRAQGKLEIDQSLLTGYRAGVAWGGLGFRCDRKDIQRSS